MPLSSRYETRNANPVRKKRAGRTEMLQTVDLIKTYRGRKVVDNVCLEVDRGEVVGLLGPNGAGKTTTFYIMVGLARPDSGRVLLNGDDITDLPIYLRARS